MSSLFPLKSPVDPGGGSPRILRVDGEAADEVFSALGSKTARRIYGELNEEPRTASEVAEAADTSLQNARYHLENLLEAELVEIVDIWYSERGTEMKVYAPASNSVVVFAGDEGEQSRIRTALTQILGTVALLGVLGLGLHLWFTRVFTLSRGGQTAPVRSEFTGDGATGSPGDAVGAVLGSISPGLWFVLGGICAILLLVGVAYLQYRYRRHSEN